MPTLLAHKRSLQGLIFTLNHSILHQYTSTQSVPGCYDNRCNYTFLLVAQLGLQSEKRTTDCQHYM